jgi:sortase A
MSDPTPTKEANPPVTSAKLFSWFVIINIVGELFLTAGVLILLFLGWQLWLNDIIVGSSQSDAASALSKEWSLGTSTPSPSASLAAPSPIAAPMVRPSKDAPPVIAKPASATAFATLLVPRLGADYGRTISQGVGLDVLNDSAAGIGHYPASQLPGAVGNFAVAAHRTTYGKSFHDINTFVPGDHIFVETKAGWYRYAYRNSVYVFPTGVDVLNAVPQMPQGITGDRIMTMTSCNPFFSAAERIVAYAVFDGWFPRSGGMPNELSEHSTTEGK